MKIVQLLFAIFLLFILSVGMTMAIPSAPVDDQLVVNQDDEDDDETDSEDDEEEDDSDGDGVDDETESEFEREVEVEEGDREWKIESELKNGNQKDKFEIEFKIGGGDEPEIEFEYKTEADSVEAEMKYRVNFDELIEFTDDGTAGYQEGSDEDVSVYELDKADWDAIVYTTEEIDGVTMYTATASTSDGVFILVLKMSTGFVDINNSIVTPNAIKIDIIIDGFDYQGNDTYLTLQTDIKTESETSVEEESEDEADGFATDEAQVGVTSGSNNAFFSWVKTAVADGTTVDVITSDLTKVEAGDDDDDGDLVEGEEHKIIFFTFNAISPERIVWDPKVGIDNAAFVAAANVPASDGSTLPFPVWVLLLSLMVPVWLRRWE